VFQQQFKFHSNDAQAGTPSAQELAHQAAARAAEKAQRLVPEWTALALQAMHEYALRHPQFTTEEVRLASPQVPAASDAHAWGHIVMQACSNGLCRPTQQFSKSMARGSHGRDIRIWISCIYRGT